MNGALKKMWRSSRHKKQIHIAIQTRLPGTDPSDAELPIATQSVSERLEQVNSAMRLLTMESKRQRKFRLLELKKQKIQKKIEEQLDFKQFTEAKLAAESESKTDSKTDSQAESKTDSKTDSEAESKTDPKTATPGKKPKFHRVYVNGINLNEPLIRKHLHSFGNILLFEPMSHRGRALITYEKELEALKAVNELTYKTFPNYTISVSLAHHQPKAELIEELLQQQQEAKKQEQAGADKEAQKAAKQLEKKQARKEKKLKKRQQRRAQTSTNSPSVNT